MVKSIFIITFIYRCAGKQLSECSYLLKMQTFSQQLQSIMNIFCAWENLRILRGQLQNIWDQLSGFLSLRLYTLSLSPQWNTQKYKMFLIFQLKNKTETYLVFPYKQHTHNMCHNLYTTQSCSRKYLIPQHNSICCSPT